MVVFASGCQHPGVTWRKSIGCHVRKGGVSDCRPQANRMSFVIMRKPGRETAQGVRCAVVAMVAPRANGTLEKLRPRIGSNEDPAV